jgi:Domain of unknown function (DUF4412)
MTAVSKRNNFKGMKAIFTWLSLALMIAMIPASTDAQILKNLVNNMKQPGADKASGQPSPGMTYHRPGTGPAISPADSAAAIKSFMTGTGGSGLFYQYRVTYHYTIKKRDSTVIDTMSLAITDGHNIRTDLGSSGASMDVLGHANQPRYSIRLFPDRRAFVFNIVDTAAVNSGGGMVYQVAKAGNESLLGYNCIHAKLTIFPAGVKNGGTTEDIWTSADVPGYTTLKNLSAVQGVTPKMMQALEQAGCGGMIVKVNVVSTVISMEMVLLTATRKSFPDAMFSIPAGYTETRY